VPAEVLGQLGNRVQHALRAFTPDDEKALAQGAAPSPAKRGRVAAEPPSAFEQILKSPITRTVVGVVTRGLMGALLGGATRRRRR
jgi:hypothetical protein